MSSDNFVSARMKAMDEWLSTLKPTKILDLGGRQSTAVALKAKFPNSAVLIANLEHVPPVGGIMIMKANGECLPVKSRSIDLVFCSEVLEHVHRIELFLAEAHRILRPGGSFLITTPNLAAWHNRLLLPLGYPPANYTAYPHVRVGSPRAIAQAKAEVQDHIRVFTRSGLLEALALHGFGIVRDGAISYAVKGRPMFRARRLIDKFLPRTWKEDLLVWAASNADAPSAAPSKTARGSA